MVSITSQRIAAIEARRDELQARWRAAICLPISLCACPRIMPSWNRSPRQPEKRERVASRHRMAELAMW